MVEFTNTFQTIGQVQICQSNMHANKEEVMTVEDLARLTRHSKSSHTNYTLDLTTMEARKCWQRDTSKQMRQKSLSNHKEGIIQNIKSARPAKGSLNRRKVN